MQSRGKTAYGIARILAISFTVQVLSVDAYAQAPLGEQIQQNRAQVRQDRELLREDQNRLRQQENQSNAYIQQTENWIQQADQQANQVQAKLNTLEAQVKSPTTLRKMLSTPGNQMYVLQSWLQNEAAQKAQAEQNIQRAQRSLQSAQSVLGQDRQQITADSAMVQHNSGIFRAEMDSNADEIRQRQQARFWRHPQRIFTNYGQAAYDAGRYEMGNNFGR